MNPHQPKIRSREKIIFDILTECKTPLLKTQIMQKANLYYNRLNKYLDFLKEKDLITKEKNHWKTTEKGIGYIIAFKQLEKLLK